MIKFRRGAIVPHPSIPSLSIAIPGASVTFDMSESLWDKESSFHLLRFSLGFFLLSFGKCYGLGM